VLQGGQGVEQEVRLDLRLQQVQSRFGRLARGSVAFLHQAQVGQLALHLPLPDLRRTPHRKHHHQQQRQQGGGGLDGRPAQGLQEGLAAQVGPAQQAPGEEAGSVPA
jgi:hypothetical protein